jgi:mono/diheme cytochrome c family protein
VHRIGLLGLLLGAVLIATGCGGGDGPGVSHGTDLANGRQQFLDAGCGGCHTLAAAGSTGTVGPNLDDAFRGAREQGFEESTFEQVVRSQIAFPGLDSVMTPNLVTGKNADDVAFFVAQCAANPDDSQCAPPGGGEITTTDGKEIFAQAGCAQCHTLAAAGSTGTIGPNLDETKPSRELAIDRVTNGSPSGAMPSFSDKLSEEQIAAVADFVTQNAGK